MKAALNSWFGPCASANISVTILSRRFPIGVACRFVYGAVNIHGVGVCFVSVFMVSMFEL